MKNFIKSKIYSLSKNRLSLIIWLILAIYLLPIHAAHAYLDPGTGSYLTQLVIGLILGATYATKSFWRSIVSRIKGRKKLKDE